MGGGPSAPGHLLAALGEEEAPAEQRAAQPQAGGSRGGVQALDRATHTALQAMHALWLGSWAAWAWHLRGHSEAAETQGL